MRSPPPCFPTRKPPSLRQPDLTCRKDSGFLCIFGFVLVLSSGFRSVEANPDNTFPFFFSFFFIPLHPLSIFAPGALSPACRGLNAKNSKQNSSHSAAGFTQLKTFTHSSVFWNGGPARRSCVLEITAGINLRMMSSSVSVYPRPCVYIYICVCVREMR